MHNMEYTQFQAILKIFPMKWGSCYFQVCKNTVRWFFGIWTIVFVGFNPNQVFWKRVLGGGFVQWLNWIYIYISILPVL